MSYLWHDALMYVSHVIFMKESRTLASFVTWISHVTYISASCHKYIRTLERHVIFMKESCHIHPWVMSQIWMRYFTYINASFHQNEWVMSRDTRTGLLYGMTQYVRHMTHSILCESLNQYVRHMTDANQYVRHMTLWINMCDTWRDTWRIQYYVSHRKYMSHGMSHSILSHAVQHMNDMTHSILSHGVALSHMTWRIHTYDMTPSQCDIQYCVIHTRLLYGMTLVRHDSILHVIQSLNITHNIDI